MGENPTKIADELLVELKRLTDGELEDHEDLIHDAIWKAWRAAQDTLREVDVDDGRAIRMGVFDSLDGQMRWDLERVTRERNEAWLERDEARGALAGIERVARLTVDNVREIGQRWRDDWSDFDGRTLKAELIGATDVLRVLAPPQTATATSATPGAPRGGDHG